MRGIESPFQIQSLVDPGGADGGGDVLAKSPTGSGKTLAFAIPIVERAHTETPLALVLVPTRELCAQVTEEFALIAGDANVASVYGGVPLEGAGREAKKAHVIVATPGRLAASRRPPADRPRRGRGARARRG